MKFLDKIGLAHLIEKLKEEMNKKANKSETLPSEDLTWGDLKG